MDTIYIGIDVGAKGVLTAILPNGTAHSHFIVSESKKDIVDFVRHIADIGKEMGARVSSCCEQLHAVYGSSAKATFSFGEIYGYIQGLMFALEIPLTPVSPKTWQKAVWSAADMVYATEDGKRRIDTKRTSFNAAQRIFPGTDFRRNERCRNWDDNKVDSYLIAEYARRSNL